MARRSEERIIDVSRFVDSYIKENSFPPSIREICAGTNYASISSVDRILVELEKGE